MESESEEEIMCCERVRTHALLAVSVLEKLEVGRVTRSSSKKRRRKFLLWNPGQMLRKYVVNRRPNIHRDRLFAMSSLRALSEEEFKANF